MVERMRRTRVLHVVKSMTRKEVAADFRKWYGPDLKYAVYPGSGAIRTGGGQHFIPSDMLILLYGVDPRECAVVRRNDSPARYLAAQEIAKEFNLIPLVPQASGDYTLPTGV